MHQGGQEDRGVGEGKTLGSPPGRARVGWAGAMSSLCRDRKCFSAGADGNNLSSARHWVFLRGLGGSESPNSRDGLASFSFTPSNSLHENMKLQHTNLW